MSKKETKKGEKKVGAVKETKKANSEVEEVVVDETYLAEHPELEADGVAIGDTIEVPKAPVATNSKLDLDKEVSILKGSEYIRTYPAGMEEAVAGFLTKEGGKYIAVDPKSIKTITVGWRESVKTKEESTGRTIDTGRMASKAVKFSEATHGEKWKDEARALANFAPKRSCIAVLG